MPVKVTPGDTKQNGTAIRTFREMRGLTRDDLVQKFLSYGASDKARMSYPYLAHIENEYADAKVETVERIALILDVPVAAIIRRPLRTTALAESVA